jgi:hypothetical protein
MDVTGSSVFDRGRNYRVNANGRFVNDNFLFPITTRPLEQEIAGSCIPRYCAFKLILFVCSGRRVKARPNTRRLKAYLVQAWPRQGFTLSQCLNWTEQGYA